MNKTFITIFAILFFGMTIVFVTFPRSTYSELEKRDLATFPKYNQDSLMNGSFTKNISQWFSDSEPYRDVLMTMSMTLKEYLKFNIGNDENSVSFVAKDEEEGLGDTANLGDIADYQNPEEGETKKASRGIIILGSGPKVRALQSFGGGENGGVQYAEAANEYQRTFGDAIQVYCMIIPTSTDFYLPESSKSLTNRQLPTIRNAYKHLDPKVKAVDCYTPLSQHVKEDIYLRTDHHWAPLGAFYAAQAFAKVAGVPFKELSSYEKHVIHNYVGSMYGFSHDIAIKNAPEDFVFYKPLGIQYTTTYINYTLDKGYAIVKESAPTQGEFFYTYPDGSGGAYCTFMGGDCKITQVRTGTKNGRRLIILKDSYGNALPGYLFYSFEEIHVLDFRYFTKNLKKYALDNKITDILFANNTFKAYANSAAKPWMQYLNQPDGTRGGVTPGHKAPKDDSKNEGNKSRRHRHSDKEESSDDD
ncbi:MAG: DHHW family protein [Muribaculaceae bacterium]|nr:DHHW family protein [Muribaculaceae bacterium]